VQLPETTLNNAKRSVLEDIRRRARALGQVASRAEAEAALNDRSTLLEIIDELQAVAVNAEG
jgi:hypothetical protein